MKHLYFVRHGQSQSNLDRVFGGHSDTPLTSLGRQQAKQAGQKIKSLGIDHIIASPILRTRDTAVIIAREIGYPVEKIEFNSLFIERDYSSLTGLSWDADLDLDGMSDIETLDSVAERARLAFEHIQSLPYETILVVSHGTFWQKFYMHTHPGEVVTDGDEPDNGEVSKLV